MDLMTTSEEVQFRAWSLIIDIYALLMPIFTERLAGLGVSMSHYDVLVNLLIFNEMRMSDLAKRTVISFSRVSRVVDELEPLGLLERKPDPRDGRAVLVALTPAGADHIREASRTHATDVIEHFGRHLTREQARNLIDALETVMAAHDRAPSPTEPWAAGS